MLRVHLSLLGLRAAPALMLPEAKSFEVEDETNHIWDYRGECTYTGNIPYLRPGFRTGRMNLRGARCKLHFFGVAEID